MSRSANDALKLVRVLGYVLASQVSQSRLGAFSLTEAMQRLLAQFALASAPWLHNISLYDVILW